jgi:hypothetical protein
VRKNPESVVATSYVFRHAVISDNGC